mmetsp:Transcript_35383/g.82733  ORF Transcript_35383/g.82733 Transcript_35383/m.82733 type:complete len:276 (-) Transcript_35383:1123-1950(-)
MPPTRKFSCSLATTSAKLLPWHVHTTRTPRITIVLAVIACSLVLTSSATMMSGVWFSSASNIATFCPSCLPADTCRRRASPTLRCGARLSPAISFDLSTMMTFTISLNFAATSRRSVVFPRPGPPISRMEPLPWAQAACARRSARGSKHPRTCLANRIVRPFTRPLLSVLRDTRWRVPSITDRFCLVNFGSFFIMKLNSSSPTSPTPSTFSFCLVGESGSLNHTTGSLPKSSASSTINDRSRFLSSCCSGFGKTCRKASSSGSRSPCAASFQESS